MLRQELARVDESREAAASPWRVLPPDTHRAHGNAWNGEQGECPANPQPRVMQAALGEESG